MFEEEVNWSTNGTIEGSPGIWTTARKINLKISNSMVINSDAIVDALSGMSLNIEINDQSVLTNVKRIIYARSDPSISDVKHALGIPQSVSTSEVIECLEALKLVEPADKERQAAVATQSRLMGTLEGSSYAATVLTGLLTIAGNDMVKKVLEILTK